MYQMARMLNVMCPWLGGAANCKKFIGIFLQIIMKAVAEGEKVYFPYFGVLYKAERWGARRNVIYFKAYGGFIEGLNPDVKTSRYTWIRESRVRHDS